CRIFPCMSAGYKRYQSCPILPAGYFQDKLIRLQTLNLLAAGHATSMPGASMFAYVDLEAYGKGFEAGGQIGVQQCFQTLGMSDLNNWIDYKQDPNPFSCGSFGGGLGNGSV